MSVIRYGHIPVWPKYFSEVAKNMDSFYSQDMLVAILFLFAAFNDNFDVKICVIAVYIHRQSYILVYCRNCNKQSSQCVRRQSIANNCNYLNLCRVLSAIVSII